MISSDLLYAKELLSGRLLSATVGGRGIGLRTMMTMPETTAAAGRNVHAIGIGRKEVNGQETDTQAVRLFVTKKIALSAVAPSDRLPKNLDGIPTDVIEAPLAFLANGAACTTARKKRQRPVIAGIGAGLHTVTIGTLGCFCRSRRAGDDASAVYVLSNNHVFAEANRGRPGDPIYQPDSLDGGTAADTIATLSRFVDLQLDGTTPNIIDAAIGQLSADVPHTLECCAIGKISGTAQAVQGMPIRKHGRTTGFAEGTVTDESIDTLVGVDDNDVSKLALFKNQFRVAPTPKFPVIGLNGDSGSLVVEGDGQRAVGLYFANPMSGQYGYANHLADVLTLLEIELL